VEATGEMETALELLWRQPGPEELRVILINHTTGEQQEFQSEAELLQALEEICHVTAAAGS
jgi:hypothetical protein